MLKVSPELVCVRVCVLAVFWEQGTCNILSQSVLLCL